MAATTETSFTIIICTRNRREELRRTLERVSAVAGQRTAAWSLLVVDNGSTDGTAELVTSLATHFPIPVRHVVEERLGIASARSRGLQECATPVATYLDDDVTLAPGWMLAVERAFLDPDVTGFGGRILPLFPSNAPADYMRAVTSERCGSTGLFDLGDATQPLGQGLPGGYPHGANMGFRTSAGRVIGGFRPAFGWGRADIPGEETDFFARLAQSGGKLLYLPDAQVLHHLQPDKVGWEYLRRWHIGYGRASVLMRPKPAPWMRALKLIEQASVWLRYSCVLLVDRSRSSSRPYRKVWQAEGRIAELLGR